ncbi:MAG: hypothetical protein ACRBFS_24470 [Aureispira sp.]
MNKIKITISILLLLLSLAYRWSQFARKTKAPINPFPIENVRGILEEQDPAPPAPAPPRAFRDEQAFLLTPF